MNICNFFRDIYNVFLVNMIHYFFPITMKIDLKSQSNNDNLKHNFIYKINKVEYNKCKFYNYGYVYQTSHTNYDCYNLNIAYAPDTIQAIHINLFNLTNTYDIIIDNTFNINKKVDLINSILLFTTKDSILETILYYYLKYHLNNNDIINKVSIEIDDKIISINYKENLNNIYEDLEKELLLLD